jgi:hypothetical protein
MIAIPSHFAVDENQHVLPNFALLVEHVSTRALVLQKIRIEYSPKCGS